MPCPPPSPFSRTAGVIEKPKTKKSKPKKKVKKEHDEKPEQEAPEVNQEKPDGENEEELKAGKQDEAFQGPKKWKGNEKWTKKQKKKRHI